jgi:MFS family permease
MLSLALAMVGQLVPAAQRGWGMGLLGTLSACGTALGPSFGGLLVGGFGWQAPFLLLVPVSLLALGAGMVGLPSEGGLPQRESVSLASLSLLVVALLCYGLALTSGGALSLGLWAGALLVTALFMGRERRAQISLLPLALLADSRLRNGLLASALVASVMVLTLLIGPFYLHGVFELDMATVGLMISGGPLLAALTGMPAGWLVDRLGARPVVWLGLISMEIAALGLAWAAGQFGPLGYLLPILLLTAGYALFQTANNSAVVGGASEQTRGVVAGLLTLSRNFGQLTGVAGLGGLFATLVGEQGLTLTSELVFGTQALFALSALLIGTVLWLVGRRREGALATA